MKIFFSIFPLLFLISCFGNKCEKARNTYNCVSVQPNYDDLKTMWSQYLNLYLVKQENQKLSTQLMNDGTGLGVKNMGIYSSSLTEIEPGYFNKVSNGFMKKLVFQDVKMKGKLKKEHFEGLDNLEILELNNGPEFEADAFEKLKMLRSFRVNKSPIDTVPTVVDKMLLNDIGSQIVLKNTNIEDFSLESLPNWFKKSHSAGFDINGSKMRCDESMIELRNIMNSNDIFIKKMANSKALNFICQSPPEMANRNLADISEKELSSIPTTTRPPMTTTEKSSQQEDLIVPGNSEKNEFNYNTNSNQEASQTQPPSSENPSDIEGTEGGIQMASAIGLGVGFGVLLLLIILALLLWFCCCKKKKEKNDEVELGKQKETLLSTQKA